MNPSNQESERDIERAIEVIREERKASVSFLQRRLRWGYTHAKSVLDELAKRGFVKQGEKPHLFELTDTMTTDTPSSRDEEIPTPRTDELCKTKSGYDSGHVSSNFARQLEREIVRLSAEREKEREELLNMASSDVAYQNSFMVQLRATLAERDKELADVKKALECEVSERSHLQGELIECNKSTSAEIQELRAQLLAAQTVIGKMRESLSDVSNRIQHSLTGDLTADVELELTEIKETLDQLLALSPDPTLLDEVNQKDRIKTNEINILTKENREQAALLSEVVTYLEGLAPKHEEARQLLSHLRQSTRETEEKV